MTQRESLKLFGERKVRSVWDNETEEWYFSVVDVVAVLTDSPDPANYWRVLKNRIKREENETITICNGLKLTAPDGKKRLTDVATPQQMFRIIQSIPSPKAEPFKQWMAQVAATRIDQVQNPELSIQQAVMDYKRLGYSDNWINQRIKSIEVRKALTDEWQRSGVSGQQYATLTDIITKEWSGFNTKAYKQFKGLKKEGLRDNMTNLELALNTLAEAATTELSPEKNPKGIFQNMEVAKSGGETAKVARKNLEAKLGRSIISPKNAKMLKSGKQTKGLPKGDE